MTDEVKPTPKAHRLAIPGFPHDLVVAVHPADDEHISTEIAANGIWEPDETAFILKAVRPGDTFVDVGANIGYFSLIASRLVGDAGKVYAFEPDADNYRLLADNCANNGCDNVALYQAALSNETTTGELFLSATNKGDHTIYPVDGARPSTTIELINGADIFCNNITFDFLKIDTQGSEYQVVQGLVSGMRQSLPGLIALLEFSPNSIRKTGVGGEDFLDLLAPLHGHFYVLDGHHGGIIPISLAHLRQWTRLTEMDIATEGFINLLFSGAALEHDSRFELVADLGLFDNALEYLLRADMAPWNGRWDARSDTLYFSSGWSFFEDWGVWSSGGASKIKFRVGAALHTLSKPQLVIRARYFAGTESTEVRLNGEVLGRFDLTAASIELPTAALEAQHITLELIHHNPVRPVDLGEGDDERLLKLGIESLSIIDPEA